jgi:hypothetical protein
MITFLSLWSKADWSKAFLTLRFCQRPIQTYPTGRCSTNGCIGTGLQISKWPTRATKTFHSRRFYDVMPTDSTPLSTSPRHTIWEAVTCNSRKLRSSDCHSAHGQEETAQQLCPCIRALCAPHIVIVPSVISRGTPHQPARETCISDGRKLKRI